MKYKYTGDNPYLITSNGKQLVLNLGDEVELLDNEAQHIESDSRFVKVDEVQHETKKRK